MLQLLPPLMDDVTSGQVSSVDTSGSSVTTWLQTLSSAVGQAPCRWFSLHRRFTSTCGDSFYLFCCVVLSSPSENCAVYASALPAENAGMRTEPDGIGSRGVQG